MHYFKKKLYYIVLVFFFWPVIVYLCWCQYKIAKSGSFLVLLESVREKLFWILELMAYMYKNVLFAFFAYITGWYRLILNVGLEIKIFLIDYFSGMNLLIFIKFCSQEKYEDCRIYLPGTCCYFFVNQSKIEKWWWCSSLHTL